MKATSSLPGRIAVLAFLVVAIAGCKKNDKPATPPEPIGTAGAGEDTGKEGPEARSPKIHLISKGTRDVVLDVKFPGSVDLDAVAVTLSKRLEEAGAENPVVTRGKGGALRVAVESVASPELVKLLVGFQGKLQVVPVDEKSRILELAYRELPQKDSIDVSLYQEAGLSAVFESDKPDRLAEVAGRIAAKVRAEDRAIGIMQQGKRAVAMVLTTRPVLSNADVANVTVARDKEGRYRTLLNLTEAASTRFAEYTAAHLGERVAVVLDDNVLLAPVVKERIGGGKVAVSSHWGEDKRRALMQARVQAFLMSMDPLPAKPRVTEVQSK